MIFALPPEPTVTAGVKARYPYAGPYVPLVPAAPMLRLAVCVTRNVESGVLGLKEMVALAELARPALAQAAAVMARMRRAQEVRCFILPPPRVGYRAPARNARWPAPDRSE